MIKQIAFGVIFLFAVIGVVLTGNIIHEFSHAQDFKDYSQNGVYTFLIVPDSGQGLVDIFKASAFARYGFQYSSEDRSQLEKISQYTEYKAYSYNLILFVLFFISLMVVSEKYLSYIFLKAYILAFKIVLRKRIASDLYKHKYHLEEAKEELDSLWEDKPKGIAIDNL
jgi:hypothetical protein